jgi:hypothetical protein
MLELDDQLAALAAMSTAQIKAEWERVFRRPAPCLSPDLIMRALAYRLQERAHGGLPASTKRELGKLAKQLRAGKRLGPDTGTSLRPGTRLVREWRGKLHQVLVLDGAYLFEDRRYNSLTRIAHTITGANWSGPRFFGLRQARGPACEVANG